MWQRRAWCLRYERDFVESEFDSHFPRKSESASPLHVSKPAKTTRVLAIHTLVICRKLANQRYLVTRLMWCL